MAFLMHTPQLCWHTHASIRYTGMLAGTKGKCVEVESAFPIPLGAPPPPPLLSLRLSQYEFVPEGTSRLGKGGIQVMKLQP